MPFGSREGRSERKGRWKGRTEMACILTGLPESSSRVSETCRTGMRIVESCETSFWSGRETSSTSVICAVEEGRSVTSLESKQVQHSHERRPSTTSSKRELHRSIPPRQLEPAQSLRACPRR